jgi:hypothetical protein
MAGLAQQSAGIPEGQENYQGESQEGPQAEQLEGQVGVQQVVQLLMQGADPEQLVQQGIPVEIIQQAIQMIMAQEQQAQQQQAPANTEQGLAMTAGAGGIQ